MTDNKQHDTRTARRPDCVTEIRMGNSVLVVSGYFKKDTTTTAADKMARVLEAEAAATQEPTYPACTGAWKKRPRRGAWPLEIIFSYNALSHVQRASQHICRKPKELYLHTH